MPKLFLRAALPAALLVAAVGTWLALHPAPPTQHKALFEGSQIDRPTLALFERSCQNCHSENTEWPWYSRVPPASWMVGKDVEDARRHVNFSAWDSYSANQQEDFLTQIGSAARAGIMPLPRYTWLHREAVLTSQERLQIYEWTRAERRRLRAAHANSSFTTVDKP